jgi:dodecin
MIDIGGLQKEAVAPLVDHFGERWSVRKGGPQMAESVYKVIELVGTSTESWEKAAKAAVERAAETLRDLRVAEVVEQDMQLQNGKVELYRAKVKVSFKYEKEAD